MWLHMLIMIRICRVDEYVECCESLNSWDFNNNTCTHGKYSKSKILGYGLVMELHVLENLIKPSLEISRKSSVQFILRLINLTKYLAFIPIIFSKSACFPKTFECVGEVLTGTLGKYTVQFVYLGQPFYGHVIIYISF